MSAEENCTAPINIEKSAVFLLDVAGTTTSISFVKDTLFPYTKEHIKEYLQAHTEDVAVKEALKEIQGEKKLDPEGLVETFKTLTDKDTDNKGVKTLQGLILKKGYDSGNLKGHVYPDVPTALENWSKISKVAIYSSGSEESQKLLFQNTTEGDMSAYISKYFDLTVGEKTESSSYEKIAKEFEVTCPDIVFINDNIEEAKAAKSAGCQTLLIKRDGTSDFSEETLKEFTVITSFNDIAVELAGKRKNTEEPEAPPPKVAKTDEDNIKTETLNETVFEEKVPADEPMEVDSVNPAEKTEDVLCENSNNTDSKIEAPTEETDKPKETIAEIKTEEVNDIKEPVKTDSIIEKDISQTNEENKSITETEKAEELITIEEITSETISTQDSDDAKHAEKIDETVQPEIVTTEENVKVTVQNSVDESPPNSDKAENDIEVRKMDSKIESGCNTEADSKVEIAEEAIEDKIEITEIAESDLLEMINPKDNVDVVIVEEALEAVSDKEMNEQENIILKKNNEENTVEESKVEAIDDVKSEKVKNIEEEKITDSVKVTEEKCTKETTETDIVNEEKIENEEIQSSTTAVNPVEEISADKVTETKVIDNEEKENKSELANGQEIENGKEKDLVSDALEEVNNDSMEIKNGTTSEIENCELDVEKTGSEEIKVKKIDETTEVPATVSVES